MVGVSVVSAPVMAMATTKGKRSTITTTKSAPLPRGTARDLYRMICALSGACERDCGVLRDGALVDNLELQAKRILRARRGAKTSLGSSLSSVASSAHRLSTSPLLTAKVPEVSANKNSKRRKLPVQDSHDKTDHRFGYDKSPLTTKPFKSLEDDDVVHTDKASLFMARADGSASLIPSVKIDKIEPYVAAMSGDVMVNSVAMSSERSPSTSPIHMDHLVKPSAMPRRPSRQSLDLGASMASTVSSFSMHQYDMSDSEDLALTPSARYASTRTPYDYDHYSRPVTPSSDLDDSFSGPSRRKGSCYSDASNSPVFGERGSSKKLRFEMDALSLYEKETSIKEVESGLVDTLQSQVDLLLTENVKALSENARLAELSQMSASEAEAQAAEKLLVVEQVKQQSEKIDELEMKYLDTKQRADAQEDCRREAEVAFQAELDTKAKLVASLQQQVTIKDEEIGRLSKRVEDISGLFASKMREQEGARVSLARSTSVGQASTKAVAATSDAVESEIVTNLRESNLFMDMELERMRASLLEKDREICNLYMHLSTKKKLIEEITKKFVQHMEEAAAAAKATSNTAEAPTVAAPSFSADGVRFDLDMFLFKNVVDKQRRMEELTASLSVMDREVESLEARVAAKELENTQLRENQEFLTRSLQAVNAHVCRIQAEKNQLSAVVEEHETRITALVSSLEGKDREVEHLTEQVDLRQTQIDHLMSDKSSGRRSLKSSLLKVRPSFSASAVKNVSRNAKGAEKDNEFSERASFSGVSARRSSVTTMRSSLDWTDAHRPSVVMAQSEFAKTKRSSVFSDVFKDISSPLTDDEESMLGGSHSDQRSTCASYGASEISDDEELFNQLFAKA